MLTNPTMDFRTKRVTLVDGERFSVLLASDGVPVFDTTIYSISQLRGRNVAARTIENNLRSIQVLYLFLRLRAIDLHERLSQISFLSIGELDELVRWCKSPLAHLRSASPTRSASAGHKEALRPLGRNIERVRQVLKPAENRQLAIDSASTRLQAIRDFVCWLIFVKLSNAAPGKRIAYTTLEKQVRSSINARIPSDYPIGRINEREGMNESSVATFLRVIEPNCPENPWIEAGCRQRNALMLKWAYQLGLRRGELLCIRIQDINFQKRTVIIARLPDNAEDTRSDLPTTKTRARELPLSPELALLTSDYIISTRNINRRARKHDFLFVAADTGEPLSISSLTKIYRVLRQKCPSIPSNVTMHVMRHTWNDNYSDLMDNNKTTEADEKKTRSYLMGWSETTNTASIYTRRHTRKKATEASIELQAAAIGAKQNLKITKTKDC